MNTQLSVNSLSFAYGEHTVLHDVSFTLRQGMLVCLLGRNGAGKSTLMRCLLGLAKGYSGDILVDGKNQRDYTAPALAKQLAYIPQAVDSVYEYTVEQFVLMGRAAHLGMFQSPGKADHEIVREKLALLDILPLAHKSFAEISGGERQLATIARALTQQSRILVMDEPTASLDYGNQIRFMRLAKELSRQGYLVVMSCHNPHQARRFADMAMVLSGGTLSAMGDAQAVITSKMICEIYGVKPEDCDAEIAGNMTK